MTTSKNPKKVKKKNKRVKFHLQDYSYGEQVRDVVYVDSKTDTVSCDGDMTTSTDGHPKVYMSFTSKKSISRSMIPDRNEVRCSYCGRKFIRE
mgnify:CR=1 FL=1